MSAKQTLLNEYLERLNWTPRELAHAINAWLEARGRTSDRIHPTTPYHWVAKGFRPYAPYPQIVAQVLSTELGGAISPGDLWPGRPELDRHQPASAIAALAADWDVDEVIAKVSELIREDPDRRVPSTGVPLITAALDGIRHSPPRLIGSTGKDAVRPALMTLIARHIADLRLLDDQAGGGALNLRYVNGELHAVLDLLRNASASADIRERLLLATADLAQLSGWMFWDSGHHAAGQRYLLLSVRAARAAAQSSSPQLRQVATESAANTLGMLAYQSAHSGQPADAIRIAEAATDHNTHASPGTRARLNGRLATAQAAIGDVHAFRNAAHQAKALLHTRRQADDPPFLYYLNADQLAAETGQALIDLAKHNPGQARALLNEAVDLLTPLSSTGLRNEYQRSALLHGCYLVQAHLQLHDLEAAVQTLRKATERLPGVQSVRCQSLLRQLRRTFARRARNPYVADLLPELDDALRSA
ncbi:hypothetical protein [Actinomadura gamaensis]|uniref:Transcriptional regulator n=1 Tax=Actinomadura gamaensis TaxID=1763541 RepID=A0ABV9U9X2_9ACTN